MKQEILPTSTKYKLKHGYLQTHLRGSLLSTSTSMDSSCSTSAAISISPPPEGSGLMSKPSCTKCAIMWNEDRVEIPFLHHSSKRGPWHHIQKQRNHKWKDQNSKQKSYFWTMRNALITKKIPYSRKEHPVNNNGDSIMSITLFTTTTIMISKFTLLSHEKMSPYNPKIH